MLEIRIYSMLKLAKILFDNCSNFRYSSSNEQNVIRYTFSNFILKRDVMLSNFFPCFIVLFHMSSNSSAAGTLSPVLFPRRAKCEQFHRFPAAALLLGSSTCAQFSCSCFGLFALNLLLLQVWKCGGCQRARWQQVSAPGNFVLAVTMWSCF